MAARRFKQVDVFTDQALDGNPVAVVLDALGLDDATMQQFAAWTNLSETTFVVPPTTPGADYRLRIFTPRAEIPFAGHPTIGSAHAVLEASIVAATSGLLHQECGAGLLPIRVADDGGRRRLSVRVPEPKVVAEERVGADELGRALGVPLGGAALSISVGPVWLVVRAESAGELRAATPDLFAIDRLSRYLDVVGVTVVALASGDGAAPVVVRSFAPAAGVPEDPVCGSGNATVGAYLAATGLLARTGDRYRASQGREVGRDGMVDVHVADGGRTIEIGGTAVTVIDGTLGI